jgi:glutathionyl-hydroquinone reductase
VKASKTKKCVIIGDSYAEDTDYGMKMRVPVEIDGKKKTYTPNKDSVKNIIQALGSETKAWMGKTLTFNVISVMGKDSIIATV